MKIGVIGLGFVGLTTSLGFAEKGISTIGYDLDTTKLNQIKTGKLPFYEPELKEVLERQLKKSFVVSDDISIVVNECNILFICVGTPKGNDGKADLSQIKNVLKEIINKINNNDSKIILVKSTVPPSTIDKLTEYIHELNIGKKVKVSLGSNPEFLREGHAWQDFMNPDRIVVGYNGNEEDKGKILDIYRSFNAEVTFTNPNTAEFSKYLSNSLLSTLISFSNEMSMIAKTIGGINVQEAFKILHLDGRFYGNPAGIISYIYPGCGYGGYCLPKDTQAIASLSESLGFIPLLLEANISVNTTIMDFWIGEMIKWNPNRNINIGILGLSFKPGSDDVRDTPALKCINLLRKEGYESVKVFDPIAMESFARTYPEIKVSYASSSKDLVDSTEVIFILTAWDEFKNVDFSGKKLYNLRYVSIVK